MTFARGVSLKTAQAFGIDDFDQLRPRFEEYLRLVLRLFTETNLTWHGQYRASLDGVTLQPPTVQSPHPTLWIGGGLSTVSAGLAADLGLPLALPSLFRWPEDFSQIAEFYRDRHEAKGHRHQPRLAFPSYVHVADTTQEARRRWRPYLEQYRDFAVGLRSGFDRPTDVESLLQGPAICGSPAEVVDRVASINDQLGLDRHQFLIDLGGLPFPLVEEQLDLLGAEVLPQLQAGPITAGETTDDEGP
jgi:alkanesulfonate monooxygenase SsuD/methylene tetrahydromethanopterin reductase-like flavin-dependent oxidoreductase (luciferase family)